MIQVFYGMGKGKTSALNGMAVRAKSAGYDVGIFRFLKGRETSEDNLLKKMGIPVMKIHSSSKFVIEMNLQEKLDAKCTIENGLNYILANRKKFQVILLDEFLDLAANSVNFFSEKYLIDFIYKIKNDAEIIITGHNEYKALFGISDLVTHMEPIKHYFDNGTKARKGFEY